jgi:hypothetical protein
MKNDIHFWIATLMRGGLALLFGSAVMVIPDMASTLLLLPFAVAISILCLAAYGVLDSAVVFITSFMASSRVPKIALRLQGTFGVMVGVILFSIVYNRVRLEWFLYLIALQALCAAIAEFTVGRHAFTRGTSIWNYAAAVVAFVAAISYLLAATVAQPSLDPRQIAWLVYGYLVAFGMAQCLTAARMLYTDRQIVAAQEHEAVGDEGTRNQEHMGVAGA